MVGIYTAPIEPNQGRAELGSDQFPSSSGERFEAFPAATWLLRGLQGSAVSSQTLVDPAGQAYANPAYAPIAADEATKKYGIPGALTFANPVPEVVARNRHDTTVEQINREDILHRQPGGFLNSAAGLAVDFLSGALDPVNIAANFVPVVGEARYAGWLASAGGAVGRAAVRAGVGAAQGAAGQAALDVPRLLLSGQDGEDFGAVDALTDIAFGGLFGGGLFAAGGMFSDAIKGLRRAPAIEAPATTGLLQSGERSSDLTPNLARKAGEASGADMSSESEAPPLRQPEPSQVSTRPEPSENLMSRDTPPSILAGPSTTFHDFELGSTDQASKRDVVQGSGDVNALHHTAVSIVPQIEAALTKAVDGIEGATVQKVRAKDLPGLEAKVAGGRPAQTISDYVGGRIVVDTPQALQSVIDRLRPHLLELEDFMGSGGKGGYRAVHAQVDLGNGMSMELQLVPREIAAVQSEAHALRQPWKRIFERDESDLTPDEMQRREDVKAQIRGVFDPAWQRAGADWQAAKVAPIGGRTKFKAFPPTRQEAAGEEARLRGAVAAVSEGRPVKVAELEQAIHARPSVGAIQAREINDDVAHLPSGRQVPVRYAIVEAADLIASQRSDMSRNPAYPAELQPRDRTRGVSGLQVDNIAQNLNPALLDKAATAADGAPIVAKDGVVESGNGRVMGIAKAYREGLATAEAYRSYLAGKGYPVDGVAQPVLVRIRQGEMDMPERASFAREANERTTLGQSATERAAGDANAMSDATLGLHRGGDIGLAANRDFVRAFIDQVVGKNDAAAMLTKDGGLSLEGRRRVEAALLARAYPDHGLIAALLEDPDNGIKGIGNALTDVAPHWALMRGEAATGQINPRADVTQFLLEAIGIIRKSRELGGNPVDLINQPDIFTGKTVDPLTVGLLATFYRKANFTSPLGRDKLALELERYIAAARATKSAPGLFGASDMVEPEQILEGLRNGKGQPGQSAGDLLGRSDRAQPGSGDAAPGRQEGGSGQRPEDGAGGSASKDLAEQATAELNRPDPEELAVSRAADEAVAAHGAARPELDQVAEHTAELEADIRRAQAAGELPEELPELEAANQKQQAAEALAKAYEQGAACMARRI